MPPENDEEHRTERLPDTGPVSRERNTPPRSWLLLYHRDGGQMVPLWPGKPTVVGRREPSDVALPESSLSRQHARFELVDGTVWVEDLGSTNGTRVNGKKIQRAPVGVGDTVKLGVVTATVLLSPVADLGVENHDRFSERVSEEAARAAAFRRPLALLMVRGPRGDEGHVARWIALLRSELRPFDLPALYSPESVEVLMPETDAEEATAMAERIVAACADTVGVRVGIAVFPLHATSTAELFNVCRSVLLRTSSAEPVLLAPRPAASPTEPLPWEPVVRHPAMKRVFDTARRLARSTIPVLIQGETGTGKEVVARTIHEAGPRGERPMCCINCGAIPEQLVESTLFGHERGAFTGATQLSLGVFETANGGTVLLDEVGELPLSAQSALLRVLETKRLNRIGSAKEIEVDVRIVAATHRDLEAMCRQGSFREDLFYRLNAMTLEIPPLRDRPEEIEPMVNLFLAQANEANDCRIRDIDAETMVLLRGYRWPGNVRELRNAIERAVVIASGSKLTPEDLPRGVRELRQGSEPEPVPGPPHHDSDLRKRMQQYEAQLIQEALERTDWNRAAAASLLGIPRRTLSHKIRLLGLARGGSFSADDQE